MLESEIMGNATQSRTHAKRSFLHQPMLTAKYLNQRNVLQ